MAQQQWQIIVTKDGSHTISIPGMKVTYHSVHGAIQESKHVFITNGLHVSDTWRVSDTSGVSDTWGVSDTFVLEIGLGTGLNALLTLIEADKHKTRIYYTAIEPLPLDVEQIKQLNYCCQLNLPEYQPLFEKMHQCGWEEMFEISWHFRLTKTKSSLFDLPADSLFFLIYFDAFAPAAQPELWTKEVFQHLYERLLPGGMLVTYCSKGDVRRAMQAAGFTIEKLQGPPGKREMLRGRKVIGT